MWRALHSPLSTLMQRLSYGGMARAANGEVVSDTESKDGRKVYFETNDPLVGDGKS